MLHPNMTVNAAGHLAFAGVDTIDLARQYGTPLYLVDEDGVRSACRMYKSTMERCMGSGAEPLYASKALSFTGLMRVMAQEGMSVDAVSQGEILVAVTGGVDPEKIYFHGNNKTDGDIAFAMEKGVGWFIVDSHEELQAVGRIAGERGIEQKILLRITPGIDPHTFEAVNTGKIDCQFGVPIETGQAVQFVQAALNTPNVRLMGYHYHIGSQIFDAVPFNDAAAIMLDFVADCKARFGFEPEVLDMGGGPGVRYVESDPVIDVEAVLENIGRYIRTRCAQLGLTYPKLLIEPGRSIVAQYGMTLYSVGTVKTITGYKNYVSIDGGMSDNPRYALYKSKYTVLNADRPGQNADFLCTVAGRECESGALIQPDVMLRRPVRGDIIAVAVTGAYNYAMASNYNRVPRPPIVMLKGGESYLSVRRETIEDELRCDL